ncbi:hypothetical protein JSE7799_01580 [Jannaschia seosinensis]|uniref:Uncharacterized protein n=1 Tax=Jannaschia seosinensis TaxID=313367 RepID=A0A0M7BAL5_9RHOB|nr:hypothetical protein [Jannaschia seosinensis]CUH38862.1 hypothetical protein JSE7799_01580 [Jannaschia seosinensis]
MKTSSKLLIALPLMTLLTACNAAGNDPVDTRNEIEATLDRDIDGDGMVLQSGVEVSAPD